MSINGGGSYILDFVRFNDANLPFTNTAFDSRHLIDLSDVSTTQMTDVRPPTTTPHVASSTANTNEELQRIERQNEKMQRALRQLTERLTTAEDQLQRLSSRNGVCCNGGRNAVCCNGTTL